jgi:eukaryotic-like serine/threonine-protein kinase
MADAVKALCYPSSQHEQPLMTRFPATSKVFRFGLFEVDTVGRTLTRDGIRVRIQDQPFRILVLLLGRPGEIVSREELKQELWPDGTYVDFDGSLTVILKRLRAALGDDPDNPRFIETVPRYGYRFIAPVAAPAGEPRPLEQDQGQPTVLEGNEVEARSVDGGPSDAQSTAKTQSSKLLYASLLASLVVAVAVFGIVTFYRRNQAKENVTAAGLTSAPVVVRKSIAVLGFHNLSKRDADDWLATAFSEMLSTELAGGEKLRLISGEDVANLRRASPWSNTDSLDRDTTMRIGTALGSDLLVLGSYTTIGNADRGQVRMDVRMQDAKSGEILTEVAEIGGTQDLFQLVARAGAKLRDRLGVPPLGTVDQNSVTASLPTNPEAARFYSLGLVKLRDYDFAAARGLFEQATIADPKFPLAYSMLSRADIALGHDDLAKAEAKKGVDLSGKLSRIQRMEIEASYDHAIAERGKAAEIYGTLFNLFPDSLDYGLQLAKLQLESYHPDEALATLHQLRQLPPPARDDPNIDVREAATILRSDADAAENLFHSAANKAKAQGKTLVYARAQEALCFSNQHHLPSPPECKEAYDAFVAAGNREQAAQCIQLMAEAQRQTGHLQEALPLYNQALAIFQEIGDRELIGVTLNNVTLIVANQGQWDVAEKNYREAKRDFETVHDLANTAGAGSNIGDILVLRGRLKEAADFYRRAGEDAVASKRARPEGFRIQYASLLQAQGDLTRARSEVEAQISSLRQYNGDPWGLANGLIVRGNILKAENNLSDAKKSYQEAAEIFKKVNASTSAADTAEADLNVEDQPAAAVTVLSQVLAQTQKDQSVGDEIATSAVLARALLAKGDVAEAQRVVGRAIRLVDLRKFPTLRTPLQIMHARAELLAEKGTASKDQAAALSELRKVADETKTLGLFEINLEARLAAAEGEMKMGHEPARAQLAALVKDSRSHGFVHVAVRAERLANLPSSVIASDSHPK